MADRWLKAHGAKGRESESRGSESIREWGHNHPKTAALAAGPRATLNTKGAANLAKRIKECPAAQRPGTLGIQILSNILRIISVFLA